MENRIIIDPKIQHGKPVIKGTRIPVTRIIGSLSSGMTKGEIIKEYEITLDDINAALNYAGKLIEDDIYHPLPNIE